MYKSLEAHSASPLLSTTHHDGIRLCLNHTYLKKVHLAGRIPFNIHKRGRSWTLIFSTAAKDGS
jgi:hypothetical protein